MSFRLNLPAHFRGQPSPAPARRAPALPPADPAHVATLSALRRHAQAWEESVSKGKPAYVETFQRNFETWSERSDVRQDSWFNLVTGHGTGRDKTMATQFDANCRLSLQLLEALYHDEDLAARIVDAEPEQTYREGFDIRLTKKTETKTDALPFPPPKPAAELPPPGAPKPKRREFADLEDELAAQCDELGVQESFMYAQILGRLYGASAVFIGANDGQKASVPLNEDRIKSIDFLHVLDRYSLWPATFYNDLNDPKFCQPETYRIFQPMIGIGAPVQPLSVVTEDLVHESRLIVFPGARTTIRRKIANWSWDDSVLQRVHSVLMQFGLSWAAATHLLSDASQGVYKVKGLLDMIVGHQKEALIDRMKLVDETRSTARMIMADADEEDFTRQATSFSGIPEMLDRVVQRLAAAARMPVTVLMGMSPAGLNATGESDIRQWYDRIRTQQANVAGPRLKRLLGLMLASRGQTGVAVEIKWRPLWQPTGKELADERKAIAETDEIYEGMGALLPEEIRESRFGGGEYSPETTIDHELTGDAMAAIKQAREPPPPGLGPDGNPPADKPPPPKDKPVA